MANIKSSKKDILLAAKKTARNKDAKSRMRTFSKKVVVASEEGNLEQAREALREAISVIAVTARKGIIHKNQAARRMRRLNAKVKKLSLAQQDAA
ncbi:MAG: 30S ribosomal protein S20 [Magnetococcales bacterium]|nr:30S ribosomal protein S20 [Magnetococcales bacterium]